MRILNAVWKDWENIKQNSSVKCFNFSLKFGEFKRKYRMPPRKFASGAASWVIDTGGDTAALLNSYSWNPVDCPKILSGMQKLLLLLLCLSHTGQPFGKRQNQRDAETDWRHNDAVPKFFTRFLIFFAVHNSHSCSCIGCIKIIRESSANCLLIKERMSFSVDKGKFSEWWLRTPLYASERWR